MSGGLMSGELIPGGRMSGGRMSGGLMSGELKSVHHVRRGAPFASLDAEKAAEKASQQWAVSQVLHHLVSPPFQFHGLLCNCAGRRDLIKS